MKLMKQMQNMKMNLFKIINEIYMNHLSLAIIIFIIFFVIINLIKPTFMYNDDGSLRTFGLGYRRKTIIPLWLVVIILAIFAYFGSFRLHSIL